MRFCVAALILRAWQPRSTRHCIGIANPLLSLFSGRPLAVTIVAFVYIAAGLIGVVSHFADFSAGLVLISALAIVAGVFMLGAHNWARWLAIGWMGLHVVISVFHSVRELAIHAVVFS